MSNTATNTCIAASCITWQLLPTFCATLGLLTICCMGETGGSEELAMAALVSGRGDTKRPAGAVIAPLPPPPQLLFRLCCCRLLLNTRGVPGNNNKPLSACKLFGRFNKRYVCCNLKEDI